MNQLCQRDHANTLRSGDNHLLEEDDIYLVDFPKGSIPKFSHDLPLLLGVDVSMNVLILFLLLLRAQLKYLPKIEKGHLLNAICRFKKRNDTT